MFVGANDGGVDERAADIIEVGIVGEGFEEASHVARGDPATEAVVDGIPGTKLGGQIPPGDAGASPVEEGLEEEPVGNGGALAAFVASDLADQGFHDGPQVVADEVTHRRSITESQVGTAQIHLNRYQTDTCKVNRA